MRIAVRQAARDPRLGRHGRRSAPLPLARAVNSTAGLGPVGAMGVAVAAIAMLTVLPALLLIGGRRAFWPFVPRFDTRRRRTAGLATRLLARLGEWIERRHRPVWIVTALASRRDRARHAHARRQPDDGERLPRRRSSPSQGQELVERSFPAGASAPTIVLVTDPAQARRGARRGRRPRPRSSQRRPVRDRRAGHAVRGHARAPIRSARRATRAIEPAPRPPPRRPEATPCSSAARRPRRPTCARRPSRHAAPRPARPARRLRDPRRCCSGRSWRPLMLMAHGRALVLRRARAEPRRLRALRRLPGRGSELPAVRVHLPRRARGRLQHLPDGARPRGGAAHADDATRC